MVAQVLACSSHGNLQSCKEAKLVLRRSMVLEVSWRCISPRPRIQLIVVGTFAFYIKARKALDVPAEVPSCLTPTPSRILPASATDTLFHRSSGSRPCYNILLVEDNLINQKVLAKQLRGAGCVVHVANHGGEALDFLAKTTLWDSGCTSNEDNTRMELSLILMDLEMPVMDGLACTRRIRDLEREGKVRHVPIIAVTANSRLEQMEIAMDAGMDDIVAKPFQIPELMQKMDQQMESLA
jgi:CheY-like chemotaxis protein